MPQADGIVLVFPQPRQGIALLNCIDPSVTDKHDPLEIASNVDFLDPANGYAPEGALRRIIRRAFSQRPARAGRAAGRDRPRAHRRPARGARAPSRAATKRTASAARIPRTDNLAHRYGPALLGCVARPIRTRSRIDLEPRPLRDQFGVVGFALFCTPEAWLSTWSGLTSRANLFKTATAIKQPALLIKSTGDLVVFPGDVERICATIPRLTAPATAFAATITGSR